MVTSIYLHGIDESSEFVEKLAIIWTFSYYIYFDFLLTAFDVSFEKSTSNYLYE